MISTVNKPIRYFILILILYFIIFSHLESVPIRVFDEARLANNALEMSKSGNWFVPTFEWKPDMWNTKPPLMIWFQVLGIKIFGSGELAIRLPSALAALLTCFFILYISIKLIKDFWFGFTAIMVLVSSVGYIQYHAVRTGDYDALLTLFTTMYPLFFLLFTETGRNKYLYFSFLSVIFAVLTKGIAGLIFLPVLPVYLLYKKQLFNLLKNKHFYIGTAIFILIIGGYYGFREMINPGYLHTVWDNEVGGRYMNAIEGHDHSFWFYYRMLVDHHFTYWSLLVPCGVAIGYFTRNDRIKRIILFATSLVIFYFLVISTCKTKLEWYNVPLYPYLAIIVAGFIHHIFNTLKDFKQFSGLLVQNVLPFIFLFLVIVKPVSETMSKSFSPKVYPWDVDYYRVSYILKDAVKGKYNLDGYTLLNDGYAAHNFFYIRLLQDKGVDIDMKYDWTNLNPEDRVIAYQNNVREYIEKNYTFEVIQSYYNVFYYQIKNGLSHE